MLERVDTSNYYYGTRYYDPKVSVWLSVDPKAYAFPSVTPYSFMMNNPVMMIDPGGGSTMFYDSEGNHLHTSHDSHTNGVTIVDDENLDSFKEKINNLDGKGSDEFWQEARDMGTTFSEEGFRIQKGAGLPNLFEDSYFDYPSMDEFYSEKGDESGDLLRDVLISGVMGEAAGISATAVFSGKKAAKRALKKAGGPAAVVSAIVAMGMTIESKMEFWKMIMTPQEKIGLKVKGYRGEKILSKMKPNAE